MSDKNVYQRIVEMKFDNREFEKNVKTTMGSIDKLNQSTNNLTKSSKNIFAGMSQNAKNIDFSKIQNGLETVQNKFSVMGTIGDQMIRNLTSAAMSSIGGIASRLTGLISTGGLNRALNIKQAQFQLEGLSVAWEDIQKDINYAVADTAYGLDAAAVAASQLVASGVEFGDTFGVTGSSPMAKALRGISGVAAMTNSSYEDISRVFTTVAGNGRLMGDQLNQLASRGLNVAATLGNSMGKTEEEIRKMVSKGQIDFATFAEAMDNAFGEHATEANKTFNGAMSNVKAALSKIGADFYLSWLDDARDMLNALRLQINQVKATIEEDDGLVQWVNGLVRAISTFTVNLLNSNVVAEKFSNDVRVASSVFHVFYEAFQTFQTAFRPFNEGLTKAKKLLQIEPASQKLATFIDGLAEKMRSFNNIIAPTGMAGEKINKLFGSIGEHIVKIKASLGDITSGVLSSFFKAFSEGLGMFKDNTNPALKLLNALDLINNKLIDFTKRLAEIKNSGKTAEIFDQLAKAGSHFGEIFATIGDAFKASLSVVNRVLSSIGTAFTNTFGSMGDIIHSLFESFGDFGALTSIEDFLGSIDNKLWDLVGNEEVWSKLTSNLETFFGYFKAGWAGVSGILSSLGIVINALVSGFADAMGVGSKFAQNLQKIGQSAGPVEKTLQFITGLIEGIKESVQKALPGLTSAFGAIGKGFGSIWKMFGEKVSKFDSGTLLGALSAGFIASAIQKIATIFWQVRRAIRSDSLGGFVNNAVYQITEIGNAISNTFSRIQDTLKASVLLKQAAAVLSFAVAVKIMAEIPADKALFATSLVSSMFAQMVLWTAVLGTIDKMPGKSVGNTMIKLAASVLILAAAMEKLSAIEPEAMANSLLVITALMSELVLAMEAFSAMGTNAEQGAATMIGLALGVHVLASALKMISDIEPEKLVNALLTVTALIFELSAAMMLMNGIKVSPANVVSLLAMALALQMLVPVIGILGSMKIETLAKGLGAVAVGIGIMVGAMALMGVIAKGGNAMAIAAMAGVITKMAEAMDLLIPVVLIFGNMPLQNLAQGMIALAAGLAMITAATAILGANAVGSLAGAAAIAIVAASLNLLIPPILILGTIPWQVLLQGLLGMAGALALMIGAAYLAAPVIPVMIGLGVAIAAIGAGVFLAGAGILALATAMTALGAAGVVGVTALTYMLSAIITLIPTLATALAEGLLNFLNTVLSGLGEVISKALDVLIENLPKMLEVLGILFEGILGLISKYMPKIMTIVGTFLKKLLETAKDLLPDLLALVSEVITGILDLIEEKIPEIAETVMNVIIGILDVLDEKLPEILEKVKQLLFDVLDKIGEFIPQFVDKSLELVVTVIQGTADAIEDHKEEIGDAVEDLVHNALDLIMEVLFGGMGGVLDAGADLFGEDGFLAGIASKFDAVWEAAGNIVQGLIDGVMEKASDIWNAGTEIAQKLLDAAMSFLGINSPSRKFIEVGNYVVMGLEKGIRDNLVKADAAGVALATATIQGAEKTFAANNISGDFFGIALENITSKGMYALSKYKSSEAFQSDLQSLSDIEKTMAETDENFAKTMEADNKLIEESFRGKKNYLGDKYANNFWDNDKLKEDLGVAQDNITELTDSIESNKSRIGALNDQVALYSIAASKASGEEKELYIAKANEARNSIAAMQEQNKASEVRIRTLNAETDAINKQLEENDRAQRTIDQLKVDYEIEAKLITDLKYELAGLNKELEERQKIYDDSKKELDEMNKHIEERDKLRKKEKRSQEENVQLALQEAWCSEHNADVRSKELEGIVSLTGIYINSQKERAQALQNEIDIEEEHQTNRQANIDAQEAAYQQLVDDQNDYNDTVQAQLEEELKIRKQMAKNIVDAMKQEVEELSQVYKDALKLTNMDISAKKMYENIDLFKDFAVAAKKSIFEGFSLGNYNAKWEANGTKSGSLAGVFLDYIQEQFDEESKFSEDIQTLVSRGFNSGVIDAVKELGAGSDQLKALLDMTAQSDIDKVNEAYERRAREAQEATAESMVRSFEKQFEDIANFNSQLKQLSSMGFSDAFVEMIKEFGAGSDELTTILSMTPEQRERIKASYEKAQEIQTTSAEALLQSYRDKRRSLEQWNQDLVNLTNTGKLSDGLIRELHDLGPESRDILDAIMTMSSSQLEELNSLYVDTPDFSEGLAKNVQNALIGLGEKNGEFGEAGYNLIMGLVSGMDSASEELNKQIEAMDQEMLDAFQKFFGIHSPSTVMAEQGEYIDKGLMVGIESLSKNVSDSLLNVCASAYLESQAWVQLWFPNIGVAIDDGIVVGINSGRSSVINAAVSVAVAAYAAACAALGVHSPSKKFAELGMYVAEGFANGMTNNANIVEQASVGMGNSAMDALRQSISTINDVLNGEINDPVIRPVLDTSMLARDISGINSLFNVAHGAELKAKYDNEGRDMTGKYEGTTINFTQNNTSPKALSRTEIYRQTNNQLRQIRSALS